jgi:putative ABC transport system substrate-binding protein
MITGLSNVNADAFEKFVELLLVAVPKMRRIGFLADPTSLVYGDTMAAARLAVERHRLEVRFAEAPRLDEIEPALSRLAKEGAQALILMPSNWFPAERQRIVKRALAYRWPMVAGPSEYAEAGALISYGVDRSALFRRAAFYVDRILKGAKPGDLPIEQPTVFELVVNARTAKALGLTIPSELRLRATRVIE